MHTYTKQAIIAIDIAVGMRARIITVSHHCESQLICQRMYTLEIL